MVLRLNVCWFVLVCLWRPVVLGFFLCSTLTVALTWPAFPMHVSACLRVQRHDVTGTGLLCWITAISRTPVIHRSRRASAEMFFLCLCLLWKGRGASFQFTKETEAEPTHGCHLAFCSFAPPFFGGK